MLRHVQLLLPSFCAISACIYIRLRASSLELEEGRETSKSIGAILHPSKMTRTRQAGAQHESEEMVALVERMQSKIIYFSKKRHKT